MKPAKETSILKAVSSYVPDLLIREISGSEHCQPSETLSLSGGLLQADASGFTKMSEELSQIGPKGAEELTGVFNRFFSAMLKIVFAHGGDVLKFGGDSLLVHFAGDPGALRATVAAAKMQQAMRRFRSISTSGRTSSLTLHVGVSAGEFHALSLGDPARKLELAVLGENVSRTILCNEAAGPGEICLTESCLGRLKPHVEVSRTRGGFFKLLDLRQKPRVSVRHQGKVGKIKNPTSMLEALVPYLPHGIYQKIEADPTGSWFESEHRRITVLFLNLMHSGALLQDIAEGREEGAVTLNGYFRTVQEIVSAHGGVITRIDPYSVGDKVLVLFGAPLAQEDDEERAVLCALRIREAFRTLEERLGRPMEHRIGINTGNAFCGEVGSAARKEYTVMGKDVNLAARLMSKAGAREILAGDQTLKALPGRFRTSKITLRAKGISESVAAFKVHQAEARSRLPKETISGGSKEVPLVGREKEIKRISKMITEVLGHNCRILSIAGEPGVGKSRLTERLLELVSERKMKGLLVDCQFYGSNTPLLPFTEILKSYCALLDSDIKSTKQRKLAVALGRVDAARWAPLFNDMLGLTTPENEWTKSLDGEKRREILFDAITKLVLDQTAKGASYLILEDVHWIDQTSLDLLPYLSQRIADQPLLLVLVHRPELSLKELERIEGYEKILLGELGREEASDLASAHLRMVSLPDEMEKLIWEKSRGNPLYLQELIRALRDSGHLVWDPGRRTHQVVSDSGQISIPDTVQDVITSRIDRLDEIGRKVIKAASVIGRVFSFDTLASILPFPLPEDELRRWLGHLGKLDLVPLKEIRPSVQYMFKHALTQEVAYGLLPFAQKRSLHLKIGDYYERKFRGALDDKCELLAHHYERSPDLHKAFFYLIKAGNKGKRSYSNQEAIQFFSRAERVYQQDRSSERRKPQIKRASVLMSQLLECRAEVHRLIGDYSRSEKDFLAMLNLSRKTKNRSRQSISLNHLAELSWFRGDYPTAQSYAKQAQAIATSRKDRSVLALCNNIFGDIYRRQGSFESALECYRTSLGYHEQADDHRGVAHANNNLGIACWSMGALTEAAKHFERALKARRKAGDKVGEAKTRNNLALVYQDRGELSRSLEMLGGALEIFSEIGDKRNSGYCLGNMGTIYKSRADYSRALKALQDSIGIFSGIGDQHALAYSIGNIGDVQLKMSRLEEAVKGYDQTLSAAKTLKDEELESETLSRYGEYYIQRREQAKAEKLFDDALALAERIKSNEFVMKALAGLSEVQLKNGQGSAASRTADRLLRLAEEENTREYLARGHLLSGMTKAVLSQGTEAETSFKKALDISIEAGFKEVTYQAHLELSRLYVDLASVRGKETLIRARDQSSEASKVLQEIAAGIEESRVRREFLRRRMADVNRSREASAAGREH